MEIGKCLEKVREHVVFTSGYGMDSFADTELRHQLTVKRLQIPHNRLIKEQHFKKSTIVDSDPPLCGGGSIFQPPPAPIPSCPGMKYLIWATPHSDISLYIDILSTK